MSDEELLGELLARWADEFDRGRELSPAELCRDRPHLAARAAQGIEKLKLMRLETITDPPKPPPSHPNAPTEAFAGLRFRPERHHASGGLGDVFVAVDQEVGREVALKRIQPRFADEPGDRARFEREAEITGRLEHPGVVPLYGRGCDADGRPYYAMRFIRGRSLRGAIEEFYKAENTKKGLGGRAVAFRGLLQSFTAACNTVAYAHSRGVIHRDLKPDNIMLGPYGETLVVDWGLAKYVGRDEPHRDDAEASVRPAPAASGEETRPGAVVGTPAFMSPEQALGRRDVGPAGDVFSLGATLYQLLTGRPPYQGATALVDAAAGKYPRPGQVCRDVPRALEAVCLKAMAFRPEERYVTARDLARDVDRWLADEPPTAHREPWRARAWRWMKRRRTLMAALGAVAATTVAALAVGVVWLNEANRRVEQQRLQAVAAKNTAEQRKQEALDAEASAARALQEAQEQRAEAKNNFVVARKAVKDYLADVSDNDELKKGNFEPLRRRLLQTAHDYYEQLAQQHSSDPELQSDRVDAYMSLANIDREIGTVEQVLDEQKKAVDLQKASTDAQPSNVNQSNLLEIQLALGESYLRVNDLSKARDVLEDAEERADRLFTENRGWRLREKLAMAHFALGELYRQQHQDEAVGEFLEARKALRLLTIDHLGQMSERRLVGTDLALAGLYLDKGDLDSAEQSALEAHTLSKEIYDAARSDDQKAAVLAGCCMQLIQLRIIRGEDGPAQAILDEALPLIQDLRRRHPDASDYEILQSWSSDELGHLNLSQGRLETAESCFKDASDELSELKERDPQNMQILHILADVDTDRGAAYGDAGLGDESLKWYGKAIECIQPVLDKDRRAAELYGPLGNAYWYRAMAFRQLGREDDALKDWDKAIELDNRGVKHLLACLRASSLARKEARPVRPEDLQDCTEAVAELHGFMKKAFLPGVTSYYAAAFLAQASTAAGQDGRLPEADRPRRMTEYADESVRLLRKAEGQGYFRAESHVADLKNDADLGPLRQREDFKALLAEVQRKTQS